MSRINAVGVAREYHDWVWTEGKGDPGFPHALNKYSPAYSPFDFGAFYNATRTAGIEVHQVEARGVGEESDLSTTISLTS